MRKNRLKEFFESEKYVPMTVDAIAEILCVPPEDNEIFLDLLDELILSGDIILGKKNRIFSSKALGFEKGIFRGNPKGFGFVVREGGDIYIPENYVRDALDGDTVLVKLRKSGKKSFQNSAEGEIIRILERKSTTIVGVFVQKTNYGLIIPDNDRLPDEIFVAPGDFGGALNGQKVVGEIISYESASTSLCCRIKEVLGFPYDFGVDVLSVIKSYDFATSFPEKVIKESEALTPPSDKDFSERLDLTESIVFTIDGDDTKDIDDAISISKTKAGYKLGVHIADVSHYVLPGSELNKEAFSRGTSVYLADRVLPMLPVKLSNDLCSLNEGVKRLTMSVFMNFDSHGNLLDYTFAKSFIKSKARMTYNEVTQILSTHPAPLCEKYSAIVPSLEMMYELAKLLNSKTKERGAVDFSIPEAKAVFDKNGKTIDIVLRENTFANNIIEEFMICANSCVAKYLSENSAPGIYRVHDNPNEEKLKNVFTFMVNNGFENCKTISSAMKAVKGTVQEAVISAMLLRSMAKAKYSPANDGHFGLMLENYCHFTSPIRRYPDLICHRALKALLENDKKALSKLKNFVSDASINCSERENAAALCERDTLDIKKAEYMEKYVGEEYSGVISSVTNFGFFVMLPNTVEGLVRLETIKDDYYVYNEKTLFLTGERTSKTFTVGDSVKIKVTQSSKITRKIDFSLIEGGVNNGGKKRTKNTGSKQKRSSRVLHRRKNRGRNRAVRNRG